MNLKPERSLLIISNVQDELIPILHQGQRVVDHCNWLIGVARKLNIPVLVMEHKRLGVTMESTRRLTEGCPVVEIVTFSYQENPKSWEAIQSFGRDQLILAGTETHISILQSAADFVRAGKHAFVVAEACSSRDGFDSDEALPRIRQSGAEIVTREMVLFEWVGSSENPLYREISLAFVKHPTAESQRK
jgi:nicotinamidase-related amidase